MVRSDDVRALVRQIFDARYRQTAIDLHHQGKQQLEQRPHAVQDRSEFKPDRLPRFIRRFLSQDLGPGQADVLAGLERSRGEQLLYPEHRVLYGKELAPERLGQTDVEGLFDAHDQLDPGERIESQVEFQVVVGRDILFRGKGFEAGQKLFCHRRREQVAVNHSSPAFRPVRRSSDTGPSPGCA